MFKRENKYLVIKWEDIDKLSQEYREALIKVVHQIGVNRSIKGKKLYNSYVVVNEEEPYAEDVWKLIEMGEGRLK